MFGFVLNFFGNFYEEENGEKHENQDEEKRCTRVSVQASIK